MMKIIRWKAKIKKDRWNNKRNKVPIKPKENYPKTFQTVLKKLKI